MRKATSMAIIVGMIIVMKILNIKKINAIEREKIRECRQKEIAYSRKVAYELPHLSLNIPDNIKYKCK